MYIVGAKLTVADIIDYIVLGDEGMRLLSLISEEYKQDAKQQIVDSLRDWNSWENACYYYPAVYASSGIYASWSAIKIFKSNSNMSVCASSSFELVEQFQDTDGLTVTMLLVIDQDFNMAPFKASKDYGRSLIEQSYSKTGLFNNKTRFNLTLSSSEFFSGIRYLIRHDLYKIIEWFSKL